MDANAAPRGPTFFGNIASRLGALPAGVLSGVLVGAFFGGVLGRILMRVIFLIEKSHKGAETDFGTVGEITFGGTLTLLILSAITGATGGTIYVVIRRWLPWSWAVARGGFFGLLMMFGPGVIFLGEVDLQIFEPAVPIFAAFVALIVTYGVCVASLTDRLRPPAAARPGPRVELAARWLVRLAAAGVLVMAVLVTQKVYDEAGTCLTANGEGGCGIRVTDD